uniref:Uncharacterized protein n=1 Tax=Accipiter nisus TaxID=211598 RepID=A0A8B9NLM4_9AVES
RSCGCWSSSVPGLHIQLIGVDFLVVQLVLQGDAARAGIDGKSAQHLWGRVLAQAVLDLPVGTLVRVGSCDRHKEGPRQSILPNLNHQRALSVPDLGGSP